MKNLDLDEELDDYDGGDLYDDDEDSAGENPHVIAVRLLLTSRNIEISAEDRGDSRLLPSNICLTLSADNHSPAYQSGYDKALFRSGTC